MCNIRSRLRRQDGAAAVEFALIVGVLALLIFGMLQFGVAFFQLQNLRAAAREGARVGAVGATADQVKARTVDASVGGLSGTGAVIVEYASDGSSFGAVNGGTRACPPKAQQTANSMVRVRINPAADTYLTEVFTLEIPLMPQISLTGAQISGQFRCEGS